MSEVLSERSKQVRRDAIDLSLANGGYHYGGSFSWPISWSIYSTRVMGPDDRFILSKGHGCWVYYVLLREVFWIQSSALKDTHTMILVTVYSVPQVVWVMGFPLPLVRHIKETEEGTWYCLCPDR